jgi:hypothetical protein
MASAQGINKVISYKKETTWGTKASSSSGISLRRVTGSFQLEKDSYASNEILASQQVRDMRHGTRRSTGSLSGELSGNAYEDFIQAAVRKDFVAGATTGAIITLSSTATTIVRSSGSFVTDGFKTGSVISVTGFTDAGNNGLFIITSMTATILTVSALAGQTRTIEAAGDTVTVLEKGKKTFVPTTSHTDDSFTVEEWYSDASVSRTFLGQQVDTMAIALQPNSMATIDFGFLGKDGEAATSSQYFTSPTAVSGEGIYSAPDGFLFIDGVGNGVVTGLNISVANNITQEAVIGSSSIGAKSRGKVAVTVDGSAIFEDTTILNYFDAESEVSLTYVLMSADNTNAFSVHMPRVKIGSATTDDGEKVVILSFSGTALEYTGSAVGVQATTIQIQDTTLS